MDPVLLHNLQLELKKNCLRYVLDKNNNPLFIYPLLKRNKNIPIESLSDTKVPRYLDVRQFERWVKRIKTQFNTTLGKARLMLFSQSNSKFIYEELQLTEQQENLAVKFNPIITTLKLIYDLNDLLWAFDIGIIDACKLSYMNIYTQIKWYPKSKEDFELFKISIMLINQLDKKSISCKGYTPAIGTLLRIKCKTPAVLLYTYVYGQLPKPGEVQHFKEEIILMSLCKKYKGGLN